MRVCFLDFDGVLNCQSWIASAKHRFTDAWPGGQAPSAEDPQYRDKLDTWLDAVRSSPECKAWSRKKDLSHINPENVTHLNTIVGATGCNICISSSWRKGNEVDYLAGLLRDRGFLYPEKVISKTGGGGHRGQEIADWIDAFVEDDEAFIRMVQRYVPPENRGDVSPQEIEGIVILDDEGRLEPYSDYHVQPQFWGVGLTAYHAKQAIAVLNRPFERRSYEVEVVAR